MKNKFFQIIIFIALFLVPAIGNIGVRPVQAGESREDNFQAERLTLSRAKQIALANSPSLDAAFERINQAREVVSQAKAACLPTIAATAGWDYTEATQYTGAGYDETKYSNRISATQVLFDGFYRKYANLSAQYGVEMRLAGQKEVKRLLAWSVAQAFLNTQLALENIKIAQSDIDFNRKQEIEAAAKQKIGTGSFSDVLNFQTKVNSAASLLLRARQDLKESTYGLAALLGYKNARLPHNMTVEPLSFEEPELLQSPVDLESLDSKMDELLAGRPDLNNASLAVRDAQARIQMAKASYYPTISLTGAYGANSGNSFLDKDRMAASAGININFEIFSGGVTKSRVREALSVKREFENTFKDASIKAVSNIRSSAENVTTTLQQLNLQKKNTRLIETTRELVEKEYTAGQVSLVRLNEAQNNFVNAMGERSITMASFILALEEFNYYTGGNIN
ncbi:TolC family protein [Desulfobacterales bacterium HSG16]|nr:TolC family protein [Desulfobacterales bacterium HSG16]